MRHQSLGLNQTIANQAKLQSSTLGVMCLDALTTVEEGLEALEVKQPVTILTMKEQAEGPLGEAEASQMQTEMQGEEVSSQLENA